MFRKLGIHLTLYNLLILFVLLIIIACFVFMGSPRTHMGSVTQDMWDVALSGELPQSRRHSRGDEGLLTRIALGANAEILHADTQTQLSDEGMAELARLVLESESGSGRVSYDGKEYAYLRYIENPQSGTRIVLQETVALSEAVLSFISRTAPVFLTCMALVFAASLAITARALAPIRKAWERQVEFTGDASHELRTPISVISANLEVVMDEPDQPVREKEKWLQNIKAETGRMQRLVEDLLTLSRTDEGQRTLHKTLFSLSDEMHRAIEPLFPYAREKGVSLHTEVAPGMTYYGDPERIKQLAVILCDNAIKYTPGGGEVRFTVRPQGREIQLQVADAGEGIAKEHLHKIFDRFYRIDKARERESGGSGLGLSIAKWIVEEHRGAISVAGKPGAGSTFTVSLPCK